MAVYVICKASGGKMIDAINRATLKSKLVNSDIKFESYEEYERMQKLIDSCAELHVVPISYIEMWIDEHETASGSAADCLFWMLQDYLNWAKGIIHENDFNKTE